MMLLHSVICTLCSSRRTNWLWALFWVSVTQLVVFDECQAQTPSDIVEKSPLRLTGFVSVVAGKALRGEIPDSYSGPDNLVGKICPCYIADWSNAGVYTRDFSTTPESRVGIQANYKISPNIAISGQLVSRGTDNTPDLQWAYGSFKIDNAWELQVGRKRIPLYYYSDFQDIGVAYPWVTTPPELYGWEATNYNGASLRYNFQIGESDLTASVFTGAETIKDAAYQKLYYPSKNQVSWKDIVGADLEINRGELTTRLVYTQANVMTTIATPQQASRAAMSAFGIAVKYDWRDVFFISELTQLKRVYREADYSYRAPAATVGIGIHLGRWTPFLNYAQYTEKTSNLNKYTPQSFKRSSITLRYDVSSSSAVKIQFDRNIDVTRNFGGNTTVLRLCFDHVFE